MRLILLTIGILILSVSCNCQSKLTLPEPIVINSPSFDGKTLNSKTYNSIKLKMQSQKENQITDDEKWFSENNLSLPNENFYENFSTIYDYTINVDLRNSSIPQYYIKFRLSKRFEYENYNIYFYGVNASDSRFLLITNPANSEIKHFLDFGKFNNAPKTLAGDEDFVFESINWAIIEEDILYVSHGHSTYSKSTFGKNAYISAINLKNNYEIIWTSQPLTCNSTFILIDNSIICGYGFTAEPDFLYVLDKYSGERKQTIKLATGPDYIIEKQNKIYVRTYDHDYIFTIQ